MLRTTSFLATAAVAGALLCAQDAGTATTSQEPRAKPPAHVAIAKIAPRTADVSSIDGIIKAYYDVVSGPAGQQRQWARDATLYIPGVRFVIINQDDAGNATAHSMTHQEFVDSSDASLAGKAFFEHEVHRIIYRAGNVAHVLSTSEHTALPGGPVQGRSIDSLDLFFDGSRWWISGANVWEVESRNHPLPREFMP